MRRITCLIACLLLPFAVSASSSGAHSDFDPAKFEAQRAAIEAELSEGRKYAEISAADRREVLGSLEEMARLLQAGTPVAQMSENDRVALFNAQERVNTLLTQAAEDSRLICKRETPVGSHRSVTTCRTVAERRLAQEQSRSYLQSQRRGAPLPRGN